MSLFSFLRRSTNQLEIDEYHQGDIRSELPVVIIATVAGNVIAPVVTVRGDLFGSIYCREAVVEASGKIWGDLFAGRFQVETGGAIHGWFRELSETAYEAAVQGQPLPEPAAPEDSSKRLDSLPDDSCLIRDNEELDLMRRLQSEASAAATARKDVEQRFEARVGEIAGEALARADSLAASLEESRVVLAGREEQIQDLETVLAAHKSDLAAMAERAAAAEMDVLAQRQILSASQEEADRQMMSHVKLRDAKGELEVKLDEALQGVATANERLASLEAALQSSVQHGNELQESLVRWQELADDTQAKLDALQAEKDALQFEIDAGETGLDMLRLQYFQLEEDVKRSHEKLIDKDEEIKKIGTALGFAEGALQEATEELVAYRTKAIDPLAKEKAVAKARRKQAAANEKLAETLESVEALQIALEAAKTLAEDQAEQLLWAGANQESTRLELERARREANESGALAERLQDDLRAAEAIIEDHQAQIDRVESDLSSVGADTAEQLAGLEELATSLQESEAARQALMAELAAAKLAAEALETQHEVAKRVPLAQLDASEGEIQQHLKELDSQGQRLAETRALLVERDLELSELRLAFDEQLEQLRSQLKEKSDCIQQMKLAAGSHIEGLETQLDQVDQPASTEID